MCALLCSNIFLVGIIICRVGLQVRRFNSEVCLKPVFTSVGFATWGCLHGLDVVSLCGGCCVGCVGWG